MNLFCAVVAVTKHKHLEISSRRKLEALQPARVVYVLSFCLTFSCFSLNGINEIVGNS